MSKYENGVKDTNVRKIFQVQKIFVYKKGMLLQRLLLCLVQLQPDF